MEHIDSENDLHAEESVPQFSFVDEEAQTAFGQQLNILRRVSTNKYTCITFKGRGE